MTLGAGCSERHSVAPPGTGVIGVRPTEWKSEAERRDWSGKIHQVFPGWNDCKLKNLIKQGETSHVQTGSRASPEGSRTSRADRKSTRLNSSRANNAYT